MNWTNKVTDIIAESLRLCIRGALIFCGICLSFGLAYLCARFTFRLVEWIDRTYLSAPF